MRERLLMAYTVTESVYSGIQTNKESVMINNDKMWELCYKDKAAIGRSLYLILNLVVY